MFAWYRKNFLETCKQTCVCVQAKPRQNMNNRLSSSREFQRILHFSLEDIPHQIHHSWKLEKNSSCENFNFDKKKQNNPWEDNYRPKNTPKKLFSSMTFCSAIHFYRHPSITSIALKSSVCVCVDGKRITKSSHSQQRSSCTYEVTTPHTRRDLSTFALLCSQKNYPT